MLSGGTPLHPSLLEGTSPCLKLYAQNGMQKNLNQNRGVIEVIEAIEAMPQLALEAAVHVT